MGHSSLWGCQGRDLTLEGLPLDRHPNAPLQEQRCLLVAIQDAGPGDLAPDQQLDPKVTKHRKRISINPGTFVRLEELPTPAGEDPGPQVEHSEPKCSPCGLSSAGWQSASDPA